jgi:hypothetical protein
MAGFKSFGIADMVARHGGTAKEWGLLVDHLQFPRDGFSDEQIAELRRVRKEIKDSGTTVSQFLQGFRANDNSGRAMPDSFDTTALVQAAVAPGIQGIATGLGHVQNGLTQVINQGSDALVAMNETAWPATLAMAANKGAAAAAQGSNNAIEQEVANAFAGFQLPTRFITTIATALPSGSVAGTITGTTTAGEGEDRHA